jgi:hypothetical protein
LCVRFELGAGIASHRRIDLLEQQARLQQQGGAVGSDDARGCGGGSQMARLGGHGNRERSRVR